MVKRTKGKRTVTALGIWLFCLSPIGALAAPKLTVAELVRLHLESIGLSETVQQRQSTAASANARVDLLTGGSGFIEGASLFSSQDSMLMLLIEFKHPSYQREHFIFDGDETRIAHMQPGTRSPLGEFLFTYHYILGDGLFGSVLSTLWPLLDLPQEEGGPRVNYRGVKKVEGKQLHRLAYRSRKGGDCQIMLFFDAETYRHVRSEYTVEIAASMGRTPAESAGEQRTRMKMIETFSEFQKIEGLTVPTLWTIHYSQSGTRQGLLWRWTVELKDIAPNQRVDAKYFRLATTSNGDR